MKIKYQQPSAQKFTLNLNKENITNLLLSAAFWLLFLYKKRLIKSADVKIIIFSLLSNNISSRLHKASYRLVPDPYNYFLYRDRHRQKIFGCFCIEAAADFDIYVIISYNVACFDVSIFTSGNIYAACRNIAADYCVYIAVVINICCFAA